MDEYQHLRDSSDEQRPWTLDDEAIATLAALPALRVRDVVIRDNLPLVEWRSVRRVVAQAAPIVVGTLCVAPLLTNLWFPFLDSLR